MGRLIDWRREGFSSAFIGVSQAVAGRIVWCRWVRWRIGQECGCMGKVLDSWIFGTWFAGAAGCFPLYSMVDYSNCFWSRGSRLPYFGYPIA